MLEYLLMLYIICCMLYCGLHSLVQKHVAKGNWCGFLCGGHSIRLMVFPMEKIDLTYEQMELRAWSRNALSSCAKGLQYICTYIYSC